VSRRWLTIVVCSLALASWGCAKEKSELEGEQTAPLTKAQESVAAPPAKAVKPVRLPGELVPAPWLGEATLVVALGARENAIVVAAGNGWLRWFSAEGVQLGERLGAGAPQVLRTADIDGDGKDEVLFARGMGRGSAKAKVVMEVLHITKEGALATPVILPETTRQQVAGLDVRLGADTSIWIASFVSKFDVEVGRYEKKSESWEQVENRGRHRVVADLAVLANGTPVIARMYGETADAPGGVYTLREDKSPLAVPSTRGARALATLPGATGQIVMADGWHKNYGRKAQGLITLASRKSWGWTKLASVEVAGNYGFSQLRVGNPHTSEGLEIIASGNGPAVVMLPTRPELVYVLGDAIATDAAAVDLTGDARSEVVIAGPSPVIWNPR
jgi:hypothetical protein